MDLRRTKRKPVTAQWSELPRWDFKSARAALFAQHYQDFVPLGEYADEATELVDPRNEPDKEWPIYGVSNESGVFLSKLQKGSEFNSNYKRVRQDYFFHNPTRANVGSLGRVPDVPPDAITSPEYQVWKPRSGLLPEFVEILIKTDFFLDQIECHRVGGVKERLFVQNLFEIPVPIPPLPVQRKIVAHWDAFIMKRDKLGNKIHWLLDKCHSTTLKLLGIDKVTPSPVGKMFCLPWKDSERWSYEYNKRVLSGLSSVRTGTYPAKLLGEICTGLSGSTPSKNNPKYWSHGCIPWVSPKDMKRRYISDSIDHISEQAIADRQAHIVKAGSILFVVRSGILQHTVPVAMTKVDISINQDMRAFTPHDRNVMSEYLLAYFEATNPILLRLVKWSTTVQSINKEELESFSVPLPPLSIQQKIISTISRYHDGISLSNNNMERLSTYSKREIEEMILGFRSA